MKKLSILTTILAVAILPGCVKELKPSDPSGADNAATAKGKPSPPPPPASILQWQKTYGSPLNELGYAIAKANDGSGYVFTASALGKSGDIANYHGGIGADVWAVKVDNAGTIVWQQSLGGTAGDYANDIIETADESGYVFVGETKSNDGDITGNHGGYDLWVVKLDEATGNIVWKKTYGGSADELPTMSANSIIQTGDGGFMLAGGTGSTDGDVTSNKGGNDAWIIKLNSSGDMVWQKTYGGSLNEAANSIIPIAGGNYLVSAITNSLDGDLSGQVHYGGSDCWLFKIDVNGDLIWQKTYGGSQNEGADAVLATPDGNYVFSSVTTSNNGDVSGNHGSSDVWVAKIDAAGTILRKKCFGGRDVDNAVLKDIDASGKILLVGYTFSGDGDISGGYKGTEDSWALQLDADVNKLNSNVFGGRSDDTGVDAVPTPDGMYMAVGRTGSANGDVTLNHGGEDVWLVKFKFP